MRVVAAGLVALLGCGDGDLVAPPYDVYLCDAMSEADAAEWKVAVWDWNGATGRVVLAWHRGGIGENDGVDVCVAERLPEAGTQAIGITLRGWPQMTIRYLPGEARDAARHKLGHALGLRHTERGLMAEWWQTNEIGAADVAALERLWGATSPR